jgi:tetratricopeptide (TPR) repeat protein
VTTAARDAPYTLRHIEDMLGLGRGVVAGLIGAGFVTPARGPRNEYRFTFQDVVLLRTAHALRSAHVPPRRLLRSLKQLRTKLPASVPLSGLRIKAVGNEVAVREAGADWEVQSGQLLMDFEVTPARGLISFMELAPSAPSPSGAPSAQALFDAAERIEADDPAAAEASYRSALQADPGHACSAINLAALLCETGRCGQALDVCEAALVHSPGDMQLLFNKAVALEDLGRVLDALATYERCIAQGAEDADAHFNAARLHHQLGQQQQALRHFNAYRRLSRPSTT